MLSGLFAIGAGPGLITGPILTVAVSNVPSERSGTSSGLVNVGRMVGATLGVAILGSIFGAHVDSTGQDAAAFIMGNCSGVGRTSGLPVQGASGSVLALASTFRARGPVNWQTGGLPHVPSR
jgi:hypothetical protein